MQLLPFTSAFAARNTLRASHGYTVLELVLAVAIIALLATAAASSWQGHRGRLQAAQAISDITALSSAIEHFALDNHRLPHTLDELAPGQGNVRDPWRSSYRYVKHGDPATLDGIRVDRNGVAINSDFDLYSTGPDRDTRSALSAGASRDDIVRAGNGRFVGLASAYDP